MSTAEARIIPNAFEGFDTIYRSWEPILARPCARILPGEYYVTGHDEALSTVLGSCISACIRDPGKNVGGMNHFMLPAVKEGGPEPTELEARYGGFAMERLVNDLIKHGARRENLEVKIVGGGRMFNSCTDVGNSNISFVFEYLKVEGLSVVSQDVGGTSPRRVQYFPRTGRLRVKKLPSVHMSSVEKEEKAALEQVTQAPPPGDVELF